MRRRAALFSYLLYHSGRGFVNKKKDGAFRIFRTGAPFIKENPVWSRPGSYPVAVRKAEDLPLPVKNRSKMRRFSIFFAEGRERPAVFFLVEKIL